MVSDRKARAAAEAEEAFALLCQAVRENRPETSVVQLNGTKQFDDDKALEIGRALRTSTVLQQLRIPVAYLTLAGTSSLAHVLSSSQKLSTVEIVDGFEDFLVANRRSMNIFQQHEHYQRIMAVVDRLLAAMSLNAGAIRVLKLPMIYSPHTLASSLLGLRKVNKIHMKLPPTPANTDETADDANLVGRAIAALDSLKVLRVDCKSMNSMFLIHFLQGLARGPLPALQSLLLWNLPWLGTSDETESLARTISDTANAIPALKCLHLSVNKTVQDPIQDGGIGTIILQQGLKDHPSLRFLQLAGSRAVNNVVAPQLADLIRERNTKIDCLSVDCETLDDLCCIVAALETNPCLEQFRAVVQHREEGEPFMESCRRLGALLPSVTNLKVLDLRFDNQNEPMAIPELLPGFEGNTSLTTINIHPIVTDAERMLHFYSTRNTFAPKLSAATKSELPYVMERIWNKSTTTSATVLDPNHDLSCLSVLFERLRVRDDWFDKEDSKAVLPVWIDGMFHC